MVKLEKSKSVDNGVKQGDVISLLLLNLYIDNLRHDNSLLGPVFLNQQPIRTILKTIYLILLKIEILSASSCV